MPIFAWNVPLVSLVFFKRSLVFSVLLFSSNSFHWPWRKAFLSLLAIFWNSAFRWVYLSFSPLPLASLLFSAICKASSGNHFACLHYFFLNHLSLPLYNHKGFDLGRTWMSSVFPTLFNLTLNFAIRSLWSEPQSWIRHEWVSTKRWRKSNIILQNSSGVGGSEGNRVIGGNY